MTYKRSGALRGALSILLVCAFISAGILLGGCVKEGSITDIASSDKPEGRVELDPMQYPDWEIAIWDHYNRTSVPHRKNAKPITLCGRQYMSDDTVVSLDLSNFDGPADLSPLKEFEHIDYLLMYGNYGAANAPQAELTDLSPITELKGLKGFVFDGFDISDLSFIPSIEGLELLSVRRPAAEHIDYSFVRSISSLRELYINIYDGSPLDFLEGCTTLERLELGGEMGNVVSGGFPHGMTGLRRLHLDIVSLDDYSGLRDCAGMESLYISSVSFFGEGLGPDFADAHMDLSFLRSMPGLKELSIQAGSPKGIEYICSVGSLETLSLSLVYPFSMDTSEEEAIHIAEDRDLSQISKLTSLKNVSFTVLEFPWYLNDHGTADKIAHIIAEKILTSLPDGIHSFTGLVIDEENARLLCRFKALEKLETNLICGPNALDFLTETPNMKELRLNLSSNGTEGVDLAPLGRLSGLERLELEKYNSVPFENLDALSGLTHLKKLLLWDEDPAAFDNGRLSFLEGMDKLKDLELHNVHENCDLSPISSLPSLKYLSIGISFLIPGDERQTAIEQGRLDEVYASGERRHVDLSFLAPLDGLEAVSIAIDFDFEVDALDLSPLSGKGKLRRLRVEMPCGGAPDLSALSGCGALENITIVFLNENGGAVREEAKRFTEANPGFAVSENGSELYIDRVSSFEPDTQETSRSADSGDISAVPTLESIYDRGESASPTDILNGMTLALLTTAWGEPDGAYERTMTQTFRVAWWYIKGTDRMLSVKCIGIGNEVFDARIDPLTAPSCPLIEPESVPDLSYPDSDGLLTLRQAIECVNYARTMRYRMSLDIPEEEREDLSENPYCLTYAGYEAGESACFGTGVPCEEWRRDRYHSLVFHNEADTDSFRNGTPRPVWLIKLYDPSHRDGYYEEVIYVDAQTGDMYNGSKRGGYMPSPYKDRSEYASLYFQFVE